PSAFPAAIGRRRTPSSATVVSGPMASWCSSPAMSEAGGGRWKESGGERSAREDIEQPGQIDPVLLAVGEHPPGQHVGDDLRPGVVGMPDLDQPGFVIDDPVGLDLVRLIEPG